MVALKMIKYEISMLSPIGKNFYNSIELCNYFHNMEPNINGIIKRYRKISIYGKKENLHSSYFYVYPLLIGIIRKRKKYDAQFNKDIYIN